MVVFLTGASGFIGKHLAEALAAAGHRVICAVRDVAAARASKPEFDYTAVDFTRDLEASDWIPRLHGVDVVVNAVGILRERGRQTFDTLHARAPKALFEACVAAGVARVLQISALGADDQAVSRYHLSKKAADDFLRDLPLDWHIVQPSLVYGPGGTSAQLFGLLASLPLIPLPGGGTQAVQPIFIDDLTAAIVRLVETARPARRTLALVGPRALTLRDFLFELRQALGLSTPFSIAIPKAVVAFNARIAGKLPGSMLDSETWAMLERGNTADAGDTEDLLGRPPRHVRAFIAERERPGARRQALLAWLLPLLRLSVAAVWIVTGIVSLGVYPVEESYRLLARSGIDGALAPVALYGAALLDLALGFGILLLKRRRVLWLLQIALILTYTAIITWTMPEFWLHPYGPLLKNLPLLAAIWLLYETEER